MKRMIVILACSISAGCTTLVAPQAESIVATQNPQDVENCEVIGAVEARPPYIWPGDDLKQLKNRALLIGADTVFVTNRFGDVFGVAYRCAPTRD